MDLERLAEFVVIAKLQNLSKAAQELGVSGATLSARLLRFEEHLGTTLFLRSGKTMVLTGSGKQLLPNAIEILNRYQSIRKEMQTAQEHAYHKLRIAITGATLPLHLGPFLDQLVLKHPHMQLELLDDRTDGIVDGLTSGAVDLYFAPVIQDAVPKNLVCHPIGRPGEFVLLPQNHPLADRNTVSIQDLSGSQFILYPHTAEESIRTFQLRNILDSGIDHTFYDSETAVQFSSLLVPIGKGVLLYPYYTRPLPPNAVAIPVTDLPHRCEICFFHLNNNPNPDVQAFTRDYLAFAKEMSRRDNREDL